MKGKGGPFQWQIFAFFIPQGDVWICMELMDTSLDKFYKHVIDKGLTIPEDILGKIAVSVSMRRARREEKGCFFSEPSPASPASQLCLLWARSTGQPIWTFLGGFQYLILGDVIRKP